jgi:diguanylate cyclase (GGDEF)-like protein/PAS domain S-box-containing protein
MFKVVGCLVNEHDLRLVGLAAVICSLASFTAINLLHHVLKTKGYLRTVWLGVAATATGFGIWATHFIAMLAFSPGLPTGYNVALTIVSLLAAIALTGVGLTAAVSTNLSGARWLGGAIVGGGIAIMHYTGMAAFEIPGRIEWDPLLVVVSIALGALMGALALPVGLRDRSPRSMIAGAVLLTVAICSHHFTAMGAASLVPDPTIVVSESAIPTSWLAVFVSAAAIAILLLAFAGLALDIRDRRQAERAADRMRGLANAAFEGLLVCDGGRIATANASLAVLVGGSEDELVGSDLARILPNEAARLRLEEKPNVAFETVLQQKSGATIMVEVISRPISFADKPHKAIAIRDLRARKKAERDIQFLAHHDALTGLANRNTFNKRLDELIEAHQPGGLYQGAHLAVLCLDLDRFKEVNDLFGHAAGDKLLQSFGRCVTGQLRDGQMMARLGGDEFAIIAPGLGNPAQAGRIAESVFEALREENEAVSTGAALISTSIGIAIFPADAADRMSLMSHADTALYGAKADGRGTYRFFESAMGDQVRDRRLIEHDLRYAISRRELSLVYQPQARTSDGEIIGFEALLRWTNRERGVIPPNVFIPIAEECGLILQIGEWVLREACREAARWAHPLTVAVNVSAIQLHNANFGQLVHEVLFQTGLAPSRLELEITETALVRDLNRALLTLRQLKGLGVRIAMDDFGTGYSSLSNLRAFPFDKIKIDGSFIKSVNEGGQAAAIVRAVLGLGRGLDLPVLAEGVETAEEFAFLSAEACQEAQGYFLGKPQPIGAFRRQTGAEPAAESAPAERQFSAGSHRG